MPIYEYKCDNGHTFEVLQRMSDEPVAACETCDAPVQQVFHPIAVHFKGKGFYNTDYGTKNRQRETAAAGEGSSDGKADGSSDGKKGEGKQGEAKKGEGTKGDGAKGDGAKKAGSSSAPSTSSSSSKSE